MPTSFHDYLRLRAEDRPDKLAFRFLGADQRERSLTFAALEQQARRVAALVRTRCQPGERVVLLFPPGLEFVPAFYGSMIAGTISIAAYPPDPRLGPAAFASLTAILADAGATAILAPRAICQALGGKLPHPLLAFEDAFDAAPAPLEHSAPPEDQIAYLQYTSGSTGSAKGVAVSHGNLLAHCAQFVEGFALREDDHTVLWLPVHHSFGLFAGVVVPLFLGQTSTQMSPLAFLEQPSRWLAAMSTYAGTVSGGPNFAYDLCARATTATELAGFDLRPWRVAGLGGEPVRAETLRRFAEATAGAGFDPRALRPSLGISEATLVASANPELRPPLVVEFDAEALEQRRVVVAQPDTARRRTLVGLGRPLRGQTLTISAEAGHDLGEVWTAGANIAHGYWGRAEETARVFSADPTDPTRRSLRTGDLGFVYRGELFLVGRAKDLIIVRGCNVHPHDVEQSVEARLQLSPQSVAAFAVDGAEGEELVLAVEVGGEPTTAALTALAAAARAELAQQHNLRCREVRFVKRGALARTASAKLQRGECRRRYLAGELTALHADAEVDVAAAAPADVLDVLARVLRRPRAAISATARLAELGLDSMAVVELHEIARASLQLVLPYPLLLAADTRVEDLERGVAPAGTAELPTAARIGLPDDVVPSWREQTDADARPGAPARILLTGATGYLGAYLVRELLQRTSAHVTCLVRASSAAQARRRLDEALARHGAPVLPVGWAARLDARAGDFTSPQLGLPDLEYHALAEDIDTVIHGGAWVNFLYPYDVLAPANVGGLEEALRFVGRGRRKALHHLSSTAVLFAPGYQRGRTYPEQHPLMSDGVLPNGYEQTKWVADKHVELARTRGFAISNYRIGYVTGATGDGRDFRLGEFFPAMIKGCIQLGVAPRLDTRMTMVPIDYTAAAITRILTQPATLGATYHINHPAPLHFDEVIAWINERGYPLTTEPFTAWRERVTAAISSADSDNALRPYLGFVRSLEEQHVWLPDLDTRDTRDATADLPCPTSRALLATYFDLFVRCGYLPPPPGRGAAAASPPPTA